MSWFTIAGFLGIVAVFAFGPDVLRVWRNASQPPRSRSARWMALARDIQRGWEQGELQRRWK